MLDSALAQIKSKGLDSTAGEINAGGSWNKGTLYIVVGRFDGSMLAHAANNKIAGKNVMEAKDASGKLFVKDAIDAARSTGSTEFPMRWGNPATKQISDATMFLISDKPQQAHVVS